MEDVLADLSALSDSYDNVTTHVIFLHGLDGDKEKTWLSSSTPPELWPCWLAIDFSNVGVWSVGYDSAATRWLGSSMHLPDRAENILALILAERRLTDGNIIFVGHSLGGLVIKQILRSADRDASRSRIAESFLHRVRRVVFLGTPHFGASLANFAKIIGPLLRRSSSTKALERNDPNLRDLNNWYRQYCIEHQVENLVLTETRSVKLLGVKLPEWVGHIVLPDSSDPGVNATPIPIDSDHILISKPSGRGAEVYVHIGNFVSKPFELAHKSVLISEGMKEQTTAIGLLTEASERQAKALGTVQKAISTVELLATLPRNADVESTKIIDAEATHRLLSILKSRFFVGFDLQAQSRTLLESIQVGDLARASNSIKVEVISWCVRFLSVSDITLAKELLQSIDNYNDSEAATIAKAFVTANTGDSASALESLSQIKTAASKSAAFILVRNKEGSDAALSWFKNSGLTTNDLDADGKFFLIQSFIEREDWESALQIVEFITEDEYEVAPALIHLAALTHLAIVVPDELRVQIHDTPPFEARNFPLASDQGAIQHRRKAQELFEKASNCAARLGVIGASNTASDSALWLALRDIDRRDLARIELEKSMRDPDVSLRRLPLALQFGLNIDLAALEREIERKTALSGGKSADAAVARFALAFKQGSPREVASYIDRHRTQLIEQLNYKSVGFLEIEMLVQSGQKKSAESRLKELVGMGLTDLEKTRVERRVFEATDTDSVAHQIDLYESSGSITDLNNLVSLLEDQQDWVKLVSYARTVFNLTRDVADAKRYVRSLYNAGKLNELLEFTREFSIFLPQSEDIQRLRCWSLYESGLFLDARDALQQLKKNFSRSKQHMLTISIAVASGDWESLQVNVEEEWNLRSERSAKELIQVAKLAQLIQSPRLKELVYEAAQKGAADPAILIACYGIATECGWEESDKVFSWMQAASDMSDESGPVLKMTLQEIVDRQPSWENQTNQAYENLLQGNIPIFAAARLTNQNLLGLFLTPALNNQNEVDVRKRNLIFAFAGSRPMINAEPNKIAMDATALLTSELLGITSLIFDTFSEIFISHSMLGWLFEEKRRLSFHQPSKVTEAHELRQLVAHGSLQPYEATSSKSTTLSNAVGDTLASMLTDAYVERSDSDVQRLVVHPGPVHRVGSLVHEEADLTAYQGCLCNCQSVVDKLVERGVLTATEAKICTDFLSSREQPWLGAPQINDSAHLYLDDIAVSYFQHLKLLPKLHRAGLTIFISLREVTESDVLINYENQASQAMSVVESLRKKLRDGINVGKVIVGQLKREEDEDQENPMRSHPCFAIFNVMDSTHAIVSDDRYINKYLTIDVGGVPRSLLTSLDIVSLLKTRNAITEVQLAELKTNMRRFGMALIPLDPIELQYHLSDSKVTGGKVVENAGLKAIRENVLRVRMSDMLQVPQELPWLNSLFEAGFEVMKLQWYEGADESIASARSNWLLEIMDIRKWAHRLIEEDTTVEERYETQLMALMILPNHNPLSVRVIYWKWLENRILRDVKDESREMYERLVSRVSKVIEHGLRNLPGMRNEDE
ncbi:esterase/lipase family protein [Pseudomonas sp. DWP3-1-2]|uniref:esterase/lipase family protein n=1 Tax=Pseudomonas sp. DWP3-1-2 TaxID=2804645 RepID=UPI003CE9D102